MKTHIRWMAFACFVSLPALAGCSLFSISTPDKPISQRDLNTRMLTREFASNFAVRVEVAADQIAARSDDPAIQLSALRWKLGASKASQHAATQMAPVIALLDTWALAEQMEEFFASGAGANVFGAEQSTARAVAASIAMDAQKLARSVTPDAELKRYQAFVGRYAQEQPLLDLGFARTSIVDRWVTETNQEISLIASVGSISQSMSDVSERMRLLGEFAPSQAVWEAKLAVSESGLGRTDFVRLFDQANDNLDRLAKLAESSPDQLRAGINDMRASMLAISNRFDASWALMIRTVEQQREAFAVNVKQEREAALEAFDAQRIAFSKDAAVIADRAVSAGGVHVRGLFRELMLYGILLFIVVLGLPFAAGYMIGRHRGERAREL